MFQPVFCEALLHRAKQLALHTCVETCGCCEYSTLARIAPDADLFLYDWKESDPQRHLRHCGVSNALILSNLQKLHDAGKHVQLRCPIIPGINDRPDHFQGIARLIRSLPNLKGVELMAYHRLGEGKMTRFGLDARSRFQTAEPEPEQMRRWIAEMRALGVALTNRA